MDVRELVARYEARGEERDFVAAKPLFERALAEAEDARLLTGYGYLLESHGRNELRHAVVLYERAIELDPDDDKPHYHLIGARAGLREPEGAVALYEQRLVASPESLREYRFLGHAYLTAHAYTRAREIAEAGLALAPDDAVLIAVRGEAKAGLGDAVGRSPTGVARWSLIRRTSARCTAARSCSNANTASKKAPLPGRRSSTGTTPAT